MTNWARIKRAGKTAIPQGDGYQAFLRLSGEFRKRGIFIVEEGELEAFDRTLPQDQKNQWISAVLAKDLAVDASLAGARSFVGGVCEFFRDASATLPPSGGDSGRLMPAIPVNGRDIVAISVTRKGEDIKDALTRLKNNDVQKTSWTKLLRTIKWLSLGMITFWFLRILVSTIDHC